MAVQAICLLRHKFRFNLDHGLAWTDNILNVLLRRLLLQDTAKQGQRCSLGESCAVVFWSELSVST